MPFVLLAFITSLLVNKWLQRFAGVFGLFAMPGEHRRHQSPTPVVGGLAMFLTVLITMVVAQLSAVVDFSEMAYFVFAMLLLTIVGLLDDRFHISFLWRFLAQIAAVLLMLEQGNILLSLGPLFATDLDDVLLLGRYAPLMTVFATVGVINAINMSDGIDGLAGTWVLLVLLVLAWFAFDIQYSVIMCAWIGALLGFLAFNYRIAGTTARVFMGDAGSTVLGFVLAWLLIHGSQQPHTLFDPMFAVWLLALPLFDTVSIMLIRPLFGRSPFNADRIHMHHHVLDRVQSVNTTLCILVLWFLVYVAIGYYFHLRPIVPLIETLIFSGLFILHLFMQFLLSRRKILQESIV